MSSRRFLLIAALLAVVVAAGASVWAIFFRPVNVQVSQIEHDVSVQVFGLGTVEARVTSKVGFKVAGVLVELKADVGDRVPKGSILARLDDREQSARVARTRAAIAQAEANVQRATASVEKARANYTNAKRISERRQKLVQSNTTSIETAETAEAVQDAALGEFNLASSEVEVARASINDAKAQQLQETATLDFHTLAAPYDAMVTARLKELGSALGAGEPVFTLIDPQKVWVLAYIDESKAGEIQVGGPAEFVLRSLPKQRFQGKVARIEPESDRVNEERRVEIAFDLLPASFNLGEQAEVYIKTVQLPQALLVPEAAIERLVSERHFSLLEDGRYEIAGGMPDNILAVNRTRSGLRIGRAVKITAERRK